MVIILTAPMKNDHNPHITKIEKKGKRVKRDLKQESTEKMGRKTPCITD